MKVMHQRHFYSGIESKRLLFAEASDGEIKKLVDTSAQTEETRKTTKYIETVYVRSSWEIIRTVVK